MTVHVTVKGVERLTRALNGDMRRALRIISYPVAQRVKTVVAKYPKESEANRPGRRRWYERGFGPKWRSAPDKRWNPNRLKRAVIYGGNWAGVRTSETLNRSWAVGRRGNGAFVGSRASYSPEVHHHADQADFHKRRGWVTDKEAVDRVVSRGEVDRIARMAIDRVMGVK